MAVIRHDLERSRIEFSIHVLREYLEASESAFAQGARELAESLQNHQPNMEGDGLSVEDQVGTAAIMALNKLVFYHHDLIGRMRYGFVIQLYGAFEAEAKFLCATLQQRFPAFGTDASTIGDFASLKRALLPASPDQNLLAEIDRLRLLRNVLTHANGRMPDAKPNQQQAINDLIAANAGIRLGEDDYVEVERSYCEHALTTVEAFFTGLFEQHSFGQPYFFSKTRGFGITSSPSEGGHKFELIDRKEVERLLALPEVRAQLFPPKTTDSP